MKKGKLLSLFLLAMANMVGLSLVTFAWFTAKQKVDNGTNNIVAIKDEIVEDVKFYSFDTTQQGTKTQYLFNTTPISERDLGKYSIINSGYQLLVEIDFVPNSSASVRIETIAESYLGQVSYNEDGTVNYSLSERGNSLSSIVCFYAFSEEDVVLSDSGTFFTVNLSDSISGKKGFVNDDYTGLLPGKSNEICNVSNADKLFVVIDYDEASIETIYSANLGNDVTSGVGDNMVSDDEGHTYIEYVADFKLIIRKVTSNE